MDVYCSFGAGPANCRFDDESRVVSVPWFLFVLSESDDPTAQATGGSLLAADARHGTESLSFTADDADSGIHTVAVQLGGTTVESFDFGPACRFTDWNACPLSQSRTLDIDTTQVPDGAYPLRFVVADAADNVNTVDTGRTITVANQPPTSPAPPPSASPTSGGGGDHPTAGTAAADRGQHNGSGGAGDAVLTATLVNRRQAMLVPYRRSAVTISGRLTQRDGTPIAGARLDVGSQTVVPGLPGPDGGQAITDDDGRWSVTTARGPSREVTVAWRAFDRDRSYAETTRLSLLVRAGASLAVRPRRVGNGGLVTLSGRLLGMPYPDGGVLVTLQGRPRHGGHWRTFAVTRSKAGGRFRSRYRFTRVAGGVRMFLFRARVNRQDGYPYEAGIAGRRSRPGRTAGRTWQGEGAWRAAHASDRGRRLAPRRFQARLRDRLRARVAHEQLGTDRPARDQVDGGEAGGGGQLAVQRDPRSSRRRPARWPWRRWSASPPSTRLRADARTLRAPGALSPSRPSTSTTASRPRAATRRACSTTRSIAWAWLSAEVPSAVAAAGAGPPSSQSEISSGRTPASTRLTCGALAVAGLSRDARRSAAGPASCPRARAR